MTREITPVGNIAARVQVPGSKSFTNRALVCGALANGVSTVLRASDSDDTALMVNGLNQLGVLVRRENNNLHVEGTGGKLFAPKFPIPVGNAGTTFRFLLALSSVAEGTVQLDVSERMAERPIDDLLAALGALGVEARRSPMGFRFEVKGGSLRGGEATIAAAKSSQFLSALLMAAPYARNDTLLRVEGPLSSRSYVEMTLAVMESFGVRAQRREENTFAVPAGRRYAPRTFEVEADASSASYPLAAAAIAGGEVLVEGATRSSLQGDAQFASLLEKMGCAVTSSAEGIRLRRQGPLVGIDEDMNSMPDVVPTLAVVALFAGSPTRIRNVAHLRFKESDRLASLAEELVKVGADLTLHEDGISIRPRPLHGAQLDTWEDHRLAMAFALIGLRVPGIRVENPGVVSKSYPAFWKEFENLSRSSKS